MDLSMFDAHGYQVLDGLFSPAELGVVSGFLEAEREASLDEVRDHLPFESTDDLLAKITALLTDRPRFEALPQQVRNILCGHFRLQARLADTVRELARSPRLQAVLSTIFDGRPLRMHLPPTARFVLPGNDFAGVPPHQDVSYNKHVSGLVTIWVPLSAIDDDCGGVAVYHGTGHSPELATKPDGNFWLEAIPTEGYEKRHIMAQPGQGLLLNEYIVHESMPNRSARIRTSVDCRFFAAPAVSGKHYLELSSWEVVNPRSTPPGEPREESTNGG